MNSRAGEKPGSERVSFTKASAERIADAVRTVEQGDRNSGGRVTAPRLAAYQPKIFRICTFTGAWDINTFKTVTYKYQTTTPNTATALNLFADVPSPPSAANCAIAREGTAWFLIAAECYTTPT